MFRWLILLGLILVSAILQTSFMNCFAIGGIKPDLVVLWVIFWSFVRGNPEGSYLGFGAGLLVDLMNGVYIGFNSLSYLIVGFLIGQLKHKLYQDSLLIAMFISWLAVIVSQFIQYLLLCAYGQILPLASALLKVILPTATYSVVFVLFFYRKFTRSCRDGWLCSPVEQNNNIKED